MRARRWGPVLLLLGLSGFQAAAAEEAGLRAGAGRAALAEGILARALVLTDGGPAVALLTLDLPAIAPDLAQAVAAEARAAGLPEPLLFATRSAARLDGWSEQPLVRAVSGPPVPARRAEVARLAVGALRRAREALAPVRPRRGARGDGLATLHLVGADGRSRAALVHAALPYCAASPPALGTALPVAAARWPARAAVALEAHEVAACVLLLPAPGSRAAGRDDTAEAERAALEALVRAARLAAPADGPVETAPLVLHRRRVALPTALAAFLRPPGQAERGALQVQSEVAVLEIAGVRLTTVPGALDPAPAGTPDAWTVTHALDHVGAFSPAPGDDDPASGFQAFGPLGYARLEEAWRGAPAPPTPRGDDAPEDVLVVEAPPGGPAGLSGARALGRARGAREQAALRAWVAALLAHAGRQTLALSDDAARGGWAGRSGVGADACRLLAVLDAVRPLHRALGPAERDELLGLAEAADLPHDALVLAQALPFQGRALAAAFAGARPGATPRGLALVARREATSMGQSLHAVIEGLQEEADLAPHARLEVLAPAGGTPFASFTWPGQIGVTQGLSARGLSISLERFAMEPIDDRVERRARAPAEVLARRVLEHATSLEDAVRLLADTPLDGGVRFTLVDGRRREARVVERSGARAQVRGEVDGLLLQRDPDARLECFLGRCDPSIPRGGDDPRAYPALRDLLEGLAGRVRGPLLQSALAAHGEQAGASVALLFEPETLRVSLARLSGAAAGAGPAEWRTFDLLALLPPARRVPHAFPWPVDEVGEVATRPSRTRVGEVSLTDLTFASPAPSGHPQNDVIHAVYYRPPNPRGAVIALPAWKEASLAAQGFLALRLAQDGYAVLVMPLPWQVDRAPRGVGSGAWTLSADLARTRAAFQQGAADVARAALWLERVEGFAPARQAVMGVSLGGHVAALAYGAYPERFAAGCFLLAGGDLERAMLQENRTTGRIRAALLERGVTPEEGRTLVGDVDGASWARPDRARGVLLVGAEQDDVVPPANVRALAAAYPGSRLEWIPGDHYAILRHLTRVLDWVVDHLGSALAGAQHGR